MNIQKIQVRGMGSEASMLQFGGGGGGSSSGYNPWTHAGGKGFDKALGDALKGFNPSAPDFISSGDVQDALRRAQEGYSGMQDWYRDRMSGGISAEEINQRAQSLYNPEMEAALRGSASKATAEAFSRIGGDTALNRSGGGSREGIAQGLAASEINTGLTQQLVNYQSDLQRQAAGQLESDRQTQFGAAQGALGLIGSDVSTETDLLNLLRGDAQGRWTNELMNSPVGASLMRSLLLQMGTSGSASN